MVAQMGLDSVDDLFEDVPEAIRLDGLSLPDGMDEMTLTRELHELLSTNRDASRMPNFLGAGIYRHHVPAAVKSIIGRSEFITSYTPYQPEISQGMLQALFEYQSYMAELTAMDCMNCSMYDGSTAVGEAILMSHRISGGDTFLMSRAVSPERKAVARLYAKGAGISVKEVRYDETTGLVDLADLRDRMGPEVCGFYLETPNFFGPIETAWGDIRSNVGDKTLVVGVNPMALALFKPPGEVGADVVVGDAQVFGIPMSLGGPSVGILGCRKEHVRKMPGRLIGMTDDLEGRRSFCMTLQTREQHIRRSKATSNICTNEALMAVAVAAYLACKGRTGLRRTALKNVENMRALSEGIDALDGYEAPAFDSVHFNEFAVRSDAPTEDIDKRLVERGIQGGWPLEKAFPELKGVSLYATTEMHTKADYDRLIQTLEEIR